MCYNTDCLNNLSDNELLALIHQNDSNSSYIVDYFIEKHKLLVLSKARSLFLIGGDRDDLIQEGMIGLYKAMREYDPDISDNFISFAETIIYRQMCNAVKASTRKKNQPLNNYVSFNIPVTVPGGSEETGIILSDIIEAAESSNPEDLFIDKENTSMIEYELGKRLSKLEKSVYDMYISGMNYRQIAEALSRSPKAIDNALTRIRSKLSNMLS